MPPEEVVNCFVHEVETQVDFDTVVHGMIVVDRILRFDHHGLGLDLFHGHHCNRSHFCCLDNPSIDGDRHILYIVHCFHDLVILLGLDFCLGLGLFLDHHHHHALASGFSTCCCGPKTSFLDS